MGEQESKQKDEAVAVFGFVPQIGGALLGLSAVAYAAGWSQASAYYEELGAPWVVSQLPARYLLLSASSLIVAFVVGAYFGAAKLVEGATFNNLRRLFTFGAVVALLTIGAGQLLHHFGQNEAAYKEQIGSGHLFSALSGIAAAVLVSRLKESGLRWHPIHMGILFSMTMYGIWEAPHVVGLAQAELDGDTKVSPLPIATQASAPADLWRLVTPIEGHLVLVQLSDQKKDRIFRVTTSTDGWMILSSSTK
jgi:hypothetical protein